MSYDKSRSRYGGCGGGLLQGLLELAWPSRCVVCDIPGSLLCDDCRGALPWINQATSCPACGAPYGLVECTECWSGEGEVEHAFAHATCALEYTTSSSRLAKCFKDQSELGLAEIIAEMISGALDEDGAVRDKVAGVCGDVLTYVPATPAAVARRGFDHMRLVAEELADIRGMELAPLLEKGNSEDQRALGRSGRKENAEGSFSLRGCGQDLRGARVLLIDDVFTTGATLDEAAATLYQGGAENVDVATLCRVW